MTKRAPKKPKVLAPKITFIGGKWYNEYGKEVPKPQPKPQAFETQGTAYDAGARGHELQGRQQQPQQLQRYELVRAVECKCARPEMTGHVPGCKYYADALYVCERGNAETMTRLAALANQSVGELERRRVNFAKPDPHCPEPIQQHLTTTTDQRRRCWMCPYWKRHEHETPFDYQKLTDLKSPDLLPPPALFDDEDDDLPF